MHELYTFEDKTSDEVLLINGFQHINQLIPYINDLQQENKSLKEENKKLKQWDCNKDSRNSRQRVANAKLIKENQSLKDRIEKVIEKLNKLDFDKFVYSKTGLKNIKQDLLKMLGETETKRIDKLKDSDIK